MSRLSSAEEEQEVVAICKEERKPFVAVVLNPAHAPPMLPTLDGVPTTGVIAELEHVDHPKNTVILKGLQRFHIIDMVDHNSVALVTVMHDTWFGVADDLSALRFARAIAEAGSPARFRYPSIKECVLEHPLHEVIDTSDPYRGVIDAVVSNNSGEKGILFAQKREMLGFAVASAIDDLTLPERLALLLSDDGTGRLEWLYHKRINKPK